MGAKTKSIAIIACDHGYGHIRRCLIIGSQLAVEKWQVELLAPTEVVTYLQKGKKLPVNLRVIDFKTEVEVESIRKGQASDWIEFLPSLSDYDLVLSDNLVDILAIRSDAILSGSFMWHRVLENIDPPYYDRMEKLLHECQPRLIASELFATDILTRNTRFYPVGLYVAEPVPRERSRGEDLLISCGMSREAETKYANFIDELARKEEPNFNTAWVESRLLPFQAPTWMKAATFNADMYKRLKAAICRPGVGTLTDCLWGGARVYCSFEHGNREMSDNAAALSRAGVGELCASVEEAFEAACRFGKDKSKQAEHLKHLKSISFNGAREAVQIINEQD